MFLNRVVRYIGVLLFLTVAMSTARYAAAAPARVIFDGVQAGLITSTDGSIQFTGVASDGDGIQRIIAQLKSGGNGHYLSTKGKFSAKAESIPVQFNKLAAQTTWKTLRYKVPSGNYTFLLQLIDSRGDRSQVFRVPARVSGAVAKQVKGAPTVTIEFPANGGTVNSKAVYSGFAKDNRSVKRVVATIMDTENGQFLSRTGAFGRRSELVMQLTGGKNALWSSPRIQLPPGNYVLAVQSADNEGNLSGWTQTKFLVAGRKKGSAGSKNLTQNQPKPAATQAIIATRPAVKPAANPRQAGKIAANGMRYCVASGKDDDGDGFGWEKNSSCVVAGSRADTHPNCASSASDPDGDGFGWENERSCIVVTHCISAESDPDGDGFGWERNKSCIVLPAAQARFPTCASAASDPDGDGYGWESNKTCLVSR